MTSDQSPIIDTYGKGMTVTSAMKGLAATVKTLLTDTAAGNFDKHAGKVENLGLVSGEDMDANYVGHAHGDHAVDADRLHQGRLCRAGCKSMVRLATVTVSSDTTEAQPATTIDRDLQRQREVIHT